MCVKATDIGTGKVADIDILKFTNQRADSVAIECKGKEPGGTLSLEEAQDWIRRLATFFSHILAGILADLLAPHVQEPPSWVGGG